MWLEEVKKITPFEGQLAIAEGQPVPEALEQLLAQLDGFATEKGPKLVQRLGDLIAIYYI